MGSLVTPNLGPASKASMSSADSFPDEGRQLLDGLWVALPAPVPLLQAGPARHALVEGVSVAQLEVELPVGVPFIAEIKYGTLECTILLINIVCTSRAR